MLQRFRVYHVAVLTPWAVSLIARCMLLEIEFGHQGQNIHLEQWVMAAHMRMRQYLGEPLYLLGGVVLLQHIDDCHKVHNDFWLSVSTATNQKLVQLI